MMKTVDPPPSVGHRSVDFDAKLETVLAAGAKVMARESYGRATMRQVAREAGMSLAGLYHYFSSKEELLFLIQYHSFIAILDGLEERLESVADSRQRLRVMVTNHLEHFLDRINELKVCAREMESLSGPHFAEVEALRRRYFSMTLKIVESLRDEAGGSGTGARLATLYLFGMLNWIYMWYPTAAGSSAETLTDELMTLFLEGFLPRSEGQDRG